MAAAGAYLTGAVLKGGERFETGTKVSELDLTPEETARLERLGLLGSKKDAETSDDDSE